MNLVVMELLHVSSVAFEMQKLPIVVFRESCIGIKRFPTLCTFEALFMQCVIVRTSFCELSFNRVLTDMTSWYFFRMALDTNWPIIIFPKF
jgi:hypothetical protein